MNDRDLFSAIFLAVVSSGEPGHPNNVVLYTQQLFDALKAELEKL